MPQPARPARQRAPRLAPDERRAELLRAATELFVAHGPGFTTADLAAAAGVSEGTIFRYFPDKSALIAAAREGALDLDSLEPILADASALPGLTERLSAAARALSERMEQMIRVMENMGDAPDRPEPELAARLVAAVAPLFDHPDVAHGCGAPAVRSEQLATVFLGTLLANTYIAGTAGTEPMPIDAVVGFVVRGASPGRGGA